MNMESHDLSETSPWLREFLSEFTSIPASETTFSSPEQGRLEPYQYSALKFRGPIRIDKKHPISVWLATADNQVFAVKKVSVDIN